MDGNRRHTLAALDVLLTLAMNSRSGCTAGRMAGEAGERGRGGGGGEEGGLLDVFMGHSIVFLTQPHTWKV